MNLKSILVTVLIVMFGIYALKWINKQYPIPVLGSVIEGV
jgi:hypothetical protein